jgi:hippurate hydrolase
MSDEPSGLAAVLAQQSAIAEWQEDLYRKVHQHPELGHQEVRTSAEVAGALRGFGFEVTERIGSTGAEHPHVPRGHAHRPRERRAAGR